MTPEQVFANWENCTDEEKKRAFAQLLETERANMRAHAAAWEKAESDYDMCF